MAVEGFTLPVLYLRQLADQVRALGGEVAPWLARVGLTEASLGDPALVVTFPMFEGLVLGALDATREPALGLFVGQRLGATAHGILGYAATASGTIRQALGVLESYAHLRLSLLDVSHDESPDAVRVRFTEVTPLGPVGRPLVETVVLSVRNIVDAISMGACQPVAVAFTFDEPEYAAVARDLFRCAVWYGRDWTGFVVTPHNLDTPLKLADPEAFREAQAICQRELDKLKASASMTSRVRRLLLERSDGFPTLQVTARLLHVTPRTLHRRLLDEGTSFRALLDDVRHRIAAEQLRSGRCRVEEVAYALGYTDVANFRRAFKRWEAVAPSTYAATTKPPGAAGRRRR